MIPDRIGFPTARCTFRATSQGSASPIQVAWAWARVPDRFGFPPSRVAFRQHRQGSASSIQARPLQVGAGATSVGGNSGSSKRWRRHGCWGT